MNRKGFTLLEVLVATTIMAVAVVTLLGGISASMRNASRLTGYDQAVMRARSKMDELIVNHRVPSGAELEEKYDDTSGWHARITPIFDAKGCIEYLLQSVEEVTEKVIAEEKARAVLLRLQAYRLQIVPAGSE